LLGHDDETLDWFDKSKNDSKQKEAIRKSDFRLDDILIRNMRWADLIFMYPRPLVKLKELHEFAQEVNTSLKTRKSTGGETRDYDPFPKDAALIYAGYLAAGQDQIAEHIAERALELCNTPAMRQQLLAKSLLAHQRKPQLHINWGDEQLQLARKGSGPHLRQGCRFCDSSEFDHALNEFDAAEKAQDNGLSKALMLRGATYVLLRQVDRGIDDLNRAIEIAPTVAFAHRWRGWAHASKFEFDKAIQDYSKAIELDPKDAFAYSGRGRMLWTQHKLRAAIQDLDKSIVFDPSNAEAYFLRAACYKQSEDYASALGDIDQSLKLNPNDREAQYQRASILDGVKKYEEALAACNRLIESAPKNSQNYTQRATYQTKMNLFDAAINDFGKAASLDPNDALIPLYQAGVLMHVGRLKEAVAAITKSIETDPTNASAYSCRAHVFIMMDDYKSAMDDLNLGIERDPSFGNGAAYFMRAQVHEKLGETKAAESDRQEAKKLGYTDEGDAE
jgi:tetratricopeptide (TPR) repeat protein